MSNLLFNIQIAFNVTKFKLQNKAVLAFRYSFCNC